MRDPVLAMANAIGRDKGGVAVIWCPDIDMQRWLVGEVESLTTAEARPVRLAEVEAALAEPNRLVLLVPQNERDTVLDLDASRDRLLETERSQPIVLFLVRNGDGQRALAREAMSLASWIVGSDPDPDALAQVDTEAERASFKAEHGCTPEAWLEEWRSDALAPSAENYRAAFRALLLEVR